jgi:hypothetical protein
MSPSTSTGNEAPLFGSRNPFRKPGSSTAGNDEHPQILLTIRLEKTELDIQVWRDWLRNLPAEGQDIKIDGIYRSFSTLLLLRMPVTIWNLLPENPAYSFVGFVTSENMVSTISQVLAYQEETPKISAIGTGHSVSNDSQASQGRQTLNTITDMELKPGSSKRSTDDHNSLFEEDALATPRVVTGSVMFSHDERRLFMEPRMGMNALISFIVSCYLWYYFLDLSFVPGHCIGCSSQLSIQGVVPMYTILFLLLTSSWLYE